MSRVVVVTGGTRGIGRAVVERFAAATRSSRSAARTCDVTDEAAVAATFERIGRVDVLVNNAGVSSSAPLARTSLDDWRAQMDVNATGAFLCTRAVLPGHARARQRPHRDRRLDGGPRRRALHRRVHRLQARGGRAHARRRRRGGGHRA